MAGRDPYAHTGGGGGGYGDYGRTSRGADPYGRERETSDPYRANYDPYASNAAATNYVAKRDRDFDSYDRDHKRSKYEGGNTADPYARTGQSAAQDPYAGDRYRSGRRDEYAYGTASGRNDDRYAGGADQYASRDTRRASYDDRRGEYAHSDHNRRDYRGHDDRGGYDRGGYDRYNSRGGGGYQDRNSNTYASDRGGYGSNNYGDRDAGHTERGGYDRRASGGYDRRSGGDGYEDRGGRGGHGGGGYGGGGYGGGGYGGSGGGGYGGGGGGYGGGGGGGYSGGGGGGYGGDDDYRRGGGGYRGRGRGGGRGRGRGGGRGRGRGRGGGRGADREKSPEPEYIPDWDELMAYQRDAQNYKAPSKDPRLDGPDFDSPGGDDVFGAADEAMPQSGAPVSEEDPDEEACSVAVAGFPKDKEIGKLRDYFESIARLRKEPAVKDNGEVTVAFKMKKDVPFTIEWFKDPAKAVIDGARVEVKALKEFIAPGIAAQ